MTKHYEVLDGLRGTAAIAVLVFHILEYVFSDPANNPLRHAYLAVDFFFLLSGFVIAHAYDRRWPAMSVGEFFRIRLIRLHPLVVLGMLLGLIDYVFDPFAGDAQNARFWLIAANVLLGVLLLPAPALPNRFNETHSLDSPAWSLMQEYAVNIVYALFARRLGVRGLTALVLISATVLGWAGANQAHLSVGWAWDTFWLAPVRVAYPFFAGMLLYRMGGIIPMKWGYPVLSLVLLAVFMTPNSDYTGLMDAALIIFVFPLVVAAGAGSSVSGRLGTICRFFGTISYPLYILHYPFIDIYAHWLWQGNHAPATLWAVTATLIVGLIGFAWAAERYFDRPIRAWLARAGQRRSAMQSAVTPPEDRQSQPAG
jgi:peptidoglycan/LPS O-acetylase OafA/YrhL